MYFLFLIISAVLAIQAFRLMSQGWKAAQFMAEQNHPEPPKRNIHPEMEEVKNGDELLVVNFAKIQQKPTDPLYKSLTDRINQGQQIDDPWDDEDDDDGGAGVLAGASK